MNNKISLWISGNQRRSGYTPILSVNEPPFSYPGYDERKGMQSLDFYIVVKTTADYTQYTLIHNKISTADGYPNAILKIAIGIPVGMYIEHDKSPYDVLIAVKDTFVREYMTPTYGVEGGFSFTDKIVTEDAFIKILDSYKLIGDSSSQKVMRGTSTKTIFTKDVSTYLKTFRSDNDVEALGELIVAEGTSGSLVETSQKKPQKTASIQIEPNKPTPPKPSYLKNIIIAILAVVVIGQGAYLLRNNLPDDQQEIAQVPKSTNENISSSEETIEENKVDSLKLLAEEISKSLDEEDLSFDKIDSLYRVANIVKLKETRYAELYDTLSVYETVRDSFRIQHFEGGLKSILEENEGVYHILNHKGKTIISTNLDKSCKIHMLRDQHKTIIINYFIGENEEDRIHQYNDKEKRILYENACHKYKEWTSLRHYKDNFNKDKEIK